MRITTIEQARTTLQEVVMDVTADQGEDAVEAAWLDLVDAVADMCTPEVAEELRRTNT